MGLEIALPLEFWSVIGDWSATQMATWLVGLARRAKWVKYRKARRGPKKARTPRTRFPDAKHISTARLLKGEHP